MCSETGVRGLGSGRFSAYMWLLCPEFSLRYPPRITVRGQTVQVGSATLRKAPLRSSVDPWSTKYICPPLAFRRATEGSRVQRRVWGRQEGAREPYGALAPFCLRRETPAPLSAVGTAFLFSAGRPRQSPAAGRRQCTRHVMANTPVPGGPSSPPAASRCIDGRYAVSRR